MPTFDFKEIPEAHLATGAQDAFELFARDFLQYLGYEIEINPSRGADGGKDIVVIEDRKGIGGTTKVRWLVSCKHKAHSGRSVTPSDDANISDRVSANNCSGFIGFYSTLASSGLAGQMEGLKTKFEVQIFDKEKIEENLLKSATGYNLSKSYFPVSAQLWTKENPKPVQIFADQTSLPCAHCGKDLLSPTPHGILVTWFSTPSSSEKKRTSTIYWCCKGEYDQRLKQEHYTKGFIDGWKDISDCNIPVLYLQTIIGHINELARGSEYTPSALENIRDFIIHMSPYVFRDTTSAEESRLTSLLQIPSFLGGLG